jgi:hypothetical protein
MVLQRNALYTTAIYCDLGTLLVAKISLYLNLLQAQDISNFCLQVDGQLRIYPISAWEELNGVFARTSRNEHKMRENLR